MPLTPPLAQQEPRLIIVGVVLVFLVVMLWFFAILLMKNYRRCPPNRLLVVYGKGVGFDQAAKVIHGGAVFIMPLMQDYAYLCLDPCPLELPKELRGLGLDKGVKLPQAWTFAISTDEHLMQNAAVRLLGLPRQEIERLAEDIIAGRIERNLDQMENAIEPIRSVTLVEQWAEEVNADLAQLGLVTIGYR